ncbi:winged-helix domain-containing protein [Desmospora activa]|uniref:PadR family transcriptional regulator n=1 Tax=Desmospora activa DSM 45169 TaxID=1121389 RepID=A0A2T4ZCE5_9BACL|nr:winged-helix domain-containing protein [Desmospora activa]PTM59568.1 PadR family transcriptional regulator [Desmospora activa DSM 45169]
MHAGFQNPFIRIHLLYHANQQGITAQRMQSELGRHGYQVDEQIVQQHLQHLQQEHFLSAQGQDYQITPEGKQELNEVQQKLQPLYHEVVQ